jgi:hypothetical protein
MSDGVQARAEARSAIGLSRELQQNREDRPHPSRGGTRGYSVPWRLAQLRDHDNGLPTTASEASITRWAKRLVPYQMTGNKERDNLQGEDQWCMVVYLVAYPESYGDEVATFIYNETGSVYTRQDIAARLDDLCMTRKVASTEAYQAHEPHNLMKFHLFWTMPPPLGVVGIPRHRFIDVDEFQVSLQKTNRKRGHAHM